MEKSPVRSDTYFREWKPALRQVSPVKGSKILAQKVQKKHTVSRDQPSIIVIINTPVHVDPRLAKFQQSH